MPYASKEERQQAACEHKNQHHLQRKFRSIVLEQAWVVVVYGYAYKVLCLTAVGVFNAHIFRDSLCHVPSVEALDALHDGFPIYRSFQC